MLFTQVSYAPKQVRYSPTVHAKKLSLRLEGEFFSLTPSITLLDASKALSHSQCFLIRNPKPVPMIRASCRTIESQLHANMSLFSTCCATDISNQSPGRFLGRPLALPNLHAILAGGTSHFHRL